LNEAIASPEGAKESDTSNARILSAAPLGLPKAVSETGAYAPGYFLSPLRGWRSPLFFAGVAAIAPVFANFGYKVLPLVQTEDWKEAKMIVDWYNSSGIAREYPFVMTAHPGILFHLDRAPADDRVRQWSRQEMKKMPIGTALIYDRMYGRHNADRERSFNPEDINAAGWPYYDVVMQPAQNRDGTAPGPVQGDWLVYLSESAIDGAAVPTQQCGLWNKIDYSLKRTWGTVLPESYEVQRQRGGH
jgi:hypothetical protein